MKSYDFSVHILTKLPDLLIIFRKPLFSLILLISTSTFAQDTSRIVNLIQSDTSASKIQLFLQVQRPDKDTINIATSRYRVAACTHPLAQAFINGKATKVYPTGALVGLIEFKSGENILRFTVKSASGDSLWKEYIVRRAEPLRTSPRDTLVIEDVMMEPSQDMWLTGGDILEVKFKGSPGWEASFDIPNVESDIPMRELTPKEAGGLLGVYCGTYKVRPDDEVHEVQIEFHLRKSFWSKEKAYSKAKISIMPNELPRTAEIVGQRPYFNIGLGSDRLGGAKLGFTQAGIYVQVAGKVGAQYKVRLSESMAAWLPEEFAKLLPLGTPLPRSTTGSINVISNETEDIVSLALDCKLPFSSEQTVNPNNIVVDVYGATSNTNWISYQSNVTGIGNVTWKQVAGDQFQMVIEMRHRQHWGYDIDYLGNTLRVKVKRPPTILSKDSVLKGITIALDAGHGGDNKGAIGATGALEKDITISIVRQLDSILTSKGAKTVLTRTENEGPAMTNRIAKAVNSKAVMLVSIHCNSAVDNADPVLIQGTSTYYRHIGYKELSETIYSKLIELGLMQFGVIGSFNFLINSVTQIPNVLVETAFLSNPEDEMLLLDQNFQRKLALQIATGLEEYVKKHGKPK